MGFAIPQESVETQDWREGLTGKRLTYMYSRSNTGSPYYDSSGGVYGSYSGYSTTTKYDLCRDGTFSYHHSSQSSFDSVGGFGGAAGRDNSMGRWKVSTIADGESVLVLQYLNGEEVEYELTYNNGKTLLNGTRYFRTQSERERYQFSFERNSLMVFWSYFLLQFDDKGLLGSFSYELAVI